MSYENIYIYELRFLILYSLKQIKPKQSLHLEAWKPVSIGYKRRWWDCIALPDDVHPFDEGALRMEIKNFACTEEAEEITRLFLDALGDEYSVCCQG
ncbi:hypothetical protein ARALYDRAFT_914500 [Arabidopsis lyrata subsp. lyrata]|uniref:Uncharacterized protein n=1 Tax=Arabidopsis lyrata subsp. lyrata TaxID=81972 RepID=D7MER0_ARALL|nr:hypothetical protein ARALYDRAFT_914500 [Arabidopsis lyrata subsp. lyrata]